MAIYGSGIFYGSGIKYVGPASNSAQSIPVDLRFYRTSQDGVYVFWWGFDPAFITPSLIDADFDLEIDSSLSFSSPDLVSYDSSTAITYQNGNVRKGFAIPVAARVNETEQTWYARVRSRTMTTVSDWSGPLIWTIPKSVRQSSAEQLMETLPDLHVYGKGDLLLPLDERNTNLWAVEYMYGDQLDQVFYQTLLTKTNNFVDMAVDEVLYQNFGVMFNFSKPNSMQYVDYRWILMNLYLASLNGSTVEAVNLIGQAFTGVLPVIADVRDFKDFFLNVIQQGTPNAGVGEPFTEAADGVRTDFTLQYPYVFNSSVVFQNGVILTRNVDYTEVQSIPGIRFTVAPALNDVLVFFFKVGLPSDPEAILFDPTVTTSIPGTIDYENNSLSVVGTGTLFTALSAGDILVDGSGYYATIAFITDDTHLTLQAAWGGTTETVPALIATYNITPIVLWDKGTLAFGVVIFILNPGNFPLDLNLIEMLINQVLPAHIKVYYQIVV